MSEKKAAGRRSDGIARALAHRPPRGPPRRTSTARTRLRARTVSQRASSARSSSGRAPTRRRARAGKVKAQVTKSAARPAAAAAPQSEDAPIVATMAGAMARRTQKLDRRSIRRHQAR